jgi:hypothetical protein
MSVRTAATRIACVIVVCAAATARAQTLPSEPISVAGGRVTVSGDVSATIGSTDPGWFDYTDYEHSALRMLRVDILAAAHAGPHFTVLGEVRTENLERPRPYGLYLRIRPWTTRNLDVQVGRVPPTFGAFARRTYANDNPLIGYPLAYQYLTSLRPDALPANADELLRRRAQGWLARYTIGNLAPDRGVPLVSAFRWDTGVQVHGGTDAVNATVAVTAGTLSNPLFHDDNRGRQIAARVETRAIAGVVAGTSFARGPFVSAAAAEAAVGDGHDREFTQTAWGADVEYSRGHYLLRAETILSRWHVPIVRTPALPPALRAFATSIEGRYKIAPGFYVAARGDHLGFSRISGTTVTDAWDAPLSRVEAGIGFSIQRNLLLKVALQRNTRDGGLVRSDQLGAGQVVFWF